MASRYLSVRAVVMGIILMLVGCSDGSQNDVFIRVTAAPPAHSAFTTSSALTVSPNTVVQGADVALNATVSSSGQQMIAGTVTFYNGTMVLGSAGVQNGTASLSVTTSSSLLPASGSSYQLTASFSGGSGLDASNSSAVGLLVLAVAPPASINATASLDLSSANQPIFGFGGSAAFFTDKLALNQEATQIYKQLYDPVNGLNLSILRVQNWYWTYGCGGTNPAPTDPYTPGIVEGVNAAHGSPVTLLMTAWTPSTSLKSNNSPDAYASPAPSPTPSPADLGTLIKSGSSYAYDKYASFWTTSLLWYQCQGVTPDYLSIQVEPDFPATYAGCLFNPFASSSYPLEFDGSSFNETFAGYGAAFDAVYSAINEAGAGLTKVPKMIGPDTLGVNMRTKDFANSLPTNGENVAIAHQMYNLQTYANPDDGLAAEQAFNQDFSNTTVKWQTAYWQQNVDNNGQSVPAAFYTAWTIHNALTVINDNVYLYWGLTWPSGLPPPDDEQGQGLIVLPNEASFSYNDSFYAMKHFSYFIQPGYVRYNAAMDNNANERVSAYQSPHGKTTVIVVMNTSTSATDGFAMDANTLPGYTFSAMYRSTFSTSERWASLGAYSSGGVSLPPQSVVTIVLKE